MNLRTDFAVVSLMLVAMSIVWYAFALKPLAGFVLFMGLPVIYMGFRHDKPWRVLLAASFTLGFILGFAFDFVMSYNGAWSTDRLVIPWKVLGVMPIDNALGYFFMTFLTLVFYEHFIRKGSETVLGSRFKKATIASAACLGVLLLVAAFTPTLLHVPYAYAAGGSLAVALVLRSAVRHPELVPGTATIGAMFFFVWFLMEYAAVSTAGWSYPGTQYIGWVEFMQIRYPIEELLFWMLWYAPFLVFGYEYLIRDKKTL